MGTTVNGKDILYTIANNITQVTLSPGAAGSGGATAKGQELNAYAKAYKIITENEAYIDAKGSLDVPVADVIEEIFFSHQFAGASPYTTGTGGSYGGTVATTTGVNAANGFNALFMANAIDQFRQSDGVTASTIGDAGTTVDSFPYRITQAQGSSAMTITLQNSAGATPTATAGVNIPFRIKSGTAAASLKLGRTEYGSAVAATTLTLDSGATLGMVNDIESTLYIYAINDAGTIKLGITNGQRLDESILHTFIVLDANSDTATHADPTKIYSDAAITACAVRLIGRMRHTMNTVGTYDEDPIELGILGVGGGGTASGELAAGEKIFWQDTNQYIQGDLTSITIEADDNFVVNTDTVAQLNSTTKVDLVAATTNVVSTTAFDANTPSFIIRSLTANKPVVDIQNDGNDGTGPVLRLINNRSADGQDNDQAGRMEFHSKDDGTPTDFIVAQMFANVADATSGSKDGLWSLQVMSNQTLTNRIIADNSGVAVTGALTVSGNMTVSGTTTTINSTVSRLKDPIFELGTDDDGAAPSSDDDKDRGLLLHYFSGSAKTAFMGWDESATEFAFAKTATLSSEALDGTTVYGDAHFGNVKIGGGVDAVDYTLTFDGNASDGVFKWMEDEGEFRIKNTATGAAKPILFTLETGELDIAAGDVLGQINFQAPDENTDTDSRLVAASIAAVSEGDFAADNNATKLSFMTGASETATEKMALSSIGILSVNGIDMKANGNRIDLDADNDTSIRASADDTITIEVAGSDLIALTSTATFSCPVTVGVDNTGHDVKLFGATTGKYWLWDEDQDGVLQYSSLTVGVDDTGYDVKFFGATAGSFLLWNQTDDSLRLTDSTKLLIGDAQDLEIYHDGTDSVIANKTGIMKLATETSGIAVSIGHGTSETTINDNLTVTGTLTGTLATTAQGSVTSLGTLTALVITQGSSGGATAFALTNSDTNQIAMSISAANIDADVLDIAADAVTTAKVIDITADALTTGSALYIDDNSSHSAASRNTVNIIQNHASAVAATALSVQSDGGVTGVLIDKNFPAAAVAAATVRGLWVDFDHTVPSSGTAAMTDIGIDVDVNSAGLGVSTTTGLDIDVVGATTGTHTVYGLTVDVASADNNYAAKFGGGGILIKEQAAADADVTAYGQIWVKTATPNQLWWTDDAGTDAQLGAATSYYGGSIGTVALPIGQAPAVADTNTGFRSSAADHLEIVAGGADRLTANTSGIHVTSLTETSYRELKENITPLEGSLDKIMALQGVNFDWKDGQGNQIGLLADDVAKVVPEFVQFEKKGKKKKAVALQYSKMVALLIEGMKEQQQEINELKKLIPKS